MRNPLESHYGDYCAVGHTGEYFIFHRRIQIQMELYLVMRCKVPQIDTCTCFAVTEDKSTEIWRRNCKHKSNEEHVGCSEHKWMGGIILVDECICEGDLCNGDMGPYTSTSTTAPTTSKTSPATTITSTSTTASTTEKTSPTTTIKGFSCYIECLSNNDIVVS